MAHSVVAPPFTDTLAPEGQAGPDQALNPLELSAGLNAALPMLQVLKDRRNGQFVQFRAPDDSDLPKEWVTILPYYPNSQDDPRLGFWKFRQEGHPNVYIYSDVAFGEFDTDRKQLARMRLSSVLDIHRYRPDGELPPERQGEVLGLLQVAAAAFARERGRERPAVPRNDHGLHRRLGRLGHQAINHLFVRR